MDSSSQEDDTPVEALNIDQDEEQDDVDETPQFLNAGADAVEVQIDDDDVPMEDDDDDDFEEEGNGEPDAMEDSAQASVVDMAKTKMETHTDSVYAVGSYLDPTTKTLTILSGGGDDKAYLHKIVPGGATAAPESHLLAYAHTDSVSCVALNMPYITDDLTKTPRLAAVGGYDGAIVLYDPDTGAKLQNLEGPTDVEWLCFHPKGGTVLLAGSAADGTIWMFHIPMNKCLQVFVGHESAVTAGSFSPDGKSAVTASSDGTVRIWAPRTGMSKATLRLGDGAGLTCMGINGGSDGQLVIVGAEDGQAHVCHIGTKKVVASLRHYETPMNTHVDDELQLPMSVEAVGFATQNVNPSWCATAGVDGVLKIWDLTNGQCRHICKPAPSGEGEGQQDNSNGGITRLQWHPSLPLVFTSACNGTIQLWDARNGRLVHTLTGHLNVVNDMDLQFTDDGKTAVIISASDDKTVRVFELDVAALM
jgi:WD40 repeat protein